MRESRRCTSEAESTGGDIGFAVCAIDGPLVFSAWSGDDQGAERNTAAITVATERAVELRRFMGVVRVMRGRRNSTTNIHGKLD